MTGRDENQRTCRLLRAWHAGDRGALDRLLERDLGWIERKVRARLGEALRGKAETLDLVQDTVLELMRYGPRFELANRAHFRALIARIVENVLRDKHDWFQAQRRRIARERPLAEGSVVDLDPPAAQTTPSMAADRGQREALVRLALELLDPEDRNVLILREWRQRSFAEIGAELHISEDAARMRFNRTLPKVAKAIGQLRSGRLDQLLEAPGPPPGRPREPEPDSAPES